MRIARVLPVPRASSEEGGETAPEPIVALERDGAVYSVAVLDRLRDSAWSPERFPLAADFHTRVVALGCAGLADLDDALRRGERPSEARLLPGTFLWLPPCDPDRALYVQLEPGGDLAPGEVAYRIGNARGFVGHDTRVPFPAGEAEPDVEIGVAALLGEDLRDATPAEAASALAGFVVLGDWVARGLERRARAAGASTARSRDFATALGPVLVTPDEVDDVARLRTRTRVGGAARDGALVGEGLAPFTHAIASLSRALELRAGDVVGLGAVRGGQARGEADALAWGARVELVVERLGTLAGAAVRGPDPR